MVPHLPAERRVITCQGVGHYGVFNGSRWRNVHPAPGARLHPGPARRGAEPRAWPRPSASATRPSRSGFAGARGRGAWCSGSRRRGGGRPDAAAGRAAGRGAGIPQRPRGLAARGIWPRGRRARRSATGTVLPFGDAHAHRARRGRAPRRPARGRRSRARAVGRHGAAGRRLAARGGAAGLRRRRSSAMPAPRARIAEISLRDPRSRWGSCTARGELMFSWRLVMAPPAVLDYVVAHEVAHLAEMNHSPRFWAVVRRLCPDYEASARLAAAERRGAAHARLRALDLGDRAA